MKKKCADCKLPKDRESFGVNNNSKDGLCYSCKECVAKRAAHLRKTQPAKFKIRDRKNNARRKYGISLEEYEHRIDKDRCDICSRPLDPKGSKKVKPALDHCHETGSLRGVLCGNCNVGLGLFQDSVSVLEHAVRYLKSFHE